MGAEAVGSEVGPAAIAVGASVGLAAGDRVFVGAEIGLPAGVAGASCARVGLVAGFGGAVGVGAASDVGADAGVEVPVGPAPGQLRVSLMAFDLVLARTPLETQGSAETEDTKRSMSAEADQTALWSYEPWVLLRPSYGAVIRACRFAPVVHTAGAACS